MCQDRRPVRSLHRPMPVQIQDPVLHTPVLNDLFAGVRFFPGRPSGLLDYGWEKNVGLLTNRSRVFRVLLSRVMATLALFMVHLNCESMTICHTPGLIKFESKQVFQSNTPACLQFVHLLLISIPLNPAGIVGVKSLQVVPELPCQKSRFQPCRKTTGGIGVPPGVGSGSWFDLQLGQAVPKHPVQVVAGFVGTSILIFKHIAIHRAIRAPGKFVCQPVG